VDFFIFWAPRVHPRKPIGVKFRVAKWTHMPLGRAKFHMNRCNDENADFWHLGKFNTGSLPLRGNPAGKQSLDLA